ncbi:flagellar hook-length control protein FliK [Pseudomonas sp. R5(2019)]|uniref:flagellar hook-length control protein FliK n=1 Tax=Pseudomonas sp. R5(2019) TaxID=2697566 RepID=UPI0014124271|nr:flagellar hook-length control protein FliK [Pseudomonas sp. R5(2019)]NBA95774.1 flagellar hook-length control protein FliK [Pseudomonas sp. R5(2019)]
MPLASNPLLHTTSVAKTQATSVNVPERAPEAVKGGAASFDQLLAQQSASKAPPPTNVATKPAQDSPVDQAPKADEPPKVADSGKDLPAKAAADEDDSVDDSAASQTDPAVAAQATPAAEPALPAPAPTLPEPAPQALTDAATLAAEQAQAAAMAVDSEYDPSTDPLADLPMVRLALEQSAQAQGAVSAHASTGASDQTQAEPMPGLMAGITSPDEQSAADGASTESGEQAFAGLLDEGLKDIKGAASDSRVDNFAERLQALSQAAQAKPVAGSAAAAVPLNQPLAMHQGGWTEGLVNRVMYLSSQNLKSADIQLQPAELGRLDIRVNLSPDQQTQIAFSSGHAGVREALEGQQQRLRELFAQQGLSEPQVSVSDQSRGWQGQEQGQRSSGDGSRVDGIDSTDSVATAEVSNPVVIGSSAVDYYA